MAAEATLAFADMRFCVLWILNTGMVNRYKLLALYLQCPIIARNIDRIASSSCCLAADGAIATHEGIRMMAVNAKAHRPTVAGTFEQHKSTLCLNSIQLRYRIVTTVCFTT